jgi:DNA-binding transcriptional LysR family regulator
VVLEISNEYAHAGFKNWQDGPWLQSPDGQVELIALARSTHPSLLVSTSGMGSAVMDERIATAADFILLHTNTTPLDAYAERIADARRYGKPVVINEDDKVGSDGAEAARRAVEAGAGWGLMQKVVNQYAPFAFRGPDDDVETYRMMARLTGS